MKISIQTLLVLMCIIFTSFQGPLAMNVWSGFSYFDEFLCMICFIVCLIYLFTNRTKQTDIKNIFLLTILCIIGIAGNLLFKLQDNPNAIFLDILATFKNAIIYSAFKCICTNRNRNIKTIHFLARFFSIYVFFCVAFALINLLADIGMSSGNEYGIRNFKFFFNNSGNYAISFYTIAFIITIDLAFHHINYTKAAWTKIVLLFIAWGASLTSRSFAYVALFFILYLFLRHSKKQAIKPWQIFVMGIVALCIGSSSIVFFFGATRETVRNILFRRSFSVIARYFPLGSGFGTYGSNTAAIYYSKLYDEFGFNNVWGLSQDNPSMANDSFWPEIFGQFGVLGTILFICFLVRFYKRLFSVNGNHNERIVIRWMLIVFLLGTIGTKTYIHFATIGFFIVLALYENIYAKKAVPSSTNISKTKSIEHEAGENNW